MKHAPFEGTRDLKGNDFSLIPSIRQTASIFKQPVTIIKTQPESKSRNDIKHGNSEKPKQVFWEKRLERLRATNADTEMYESFELPKSMRPVGPNINGETALRSISTALHVHSQSITGQTAAKVDLEKNPGVYVNTGQPLVDAIIITEEDIRNQEERVLQARKRLEEAINLL
jgi:methyl-cpG binding transcription regulator, putative